MKISIILSVEDPAHKRRASETVAIDLPDSSVNPESEQAGVQLREDVTSIMDSYLPRITDSLVRKWQAPPPPEVKEQPAKPEKPAKAAKPAKPEKPAKAAKPVKKDKNADPKNTEDEPPAV